MPSTAVDARRFLMRRWAREVPCNTCTRTSGKRQLLRPPLSLPLRFLLCPSLSPSFFPNRSTKALGNHKQTRIRCTSDEESVEIDAGKAGGSTSAASSIDVIELAQSLGVLGERLVTLPRTTVGNLSERLESLKTWQAELSRGILPGFGDEYNQGRDKEREKEAPVDVKGNGNVGGGLAWPEEPFQSQFLGALAELEMASLTRRYPQLANTLLNNMMDLVETFELNYEETLFAEEEEEEEKEKDTSASQQTALLNDENSAQEKDDPRAELDQNPSSDANEDMVKELVEEFKKEWEPIAEALDASEQFFEDMTDMLNNDSFNHDLDTTLSTNNSIWKHSGWKEIKDLSKKLERLPQLRTLVRDLGRGSRGRGPKRLANAEEYKSGNPEGLITSNLVIEETAGVFRSGEIMNMLPSEASLLAAGKRNPILKQLWHSKRIERSLLSYERVGWMEDEPSQVLDTLEIRPSGVQGPIILCLDTSASMAGQRERVAKALVLECIRGAKLQHRKCYLFAFSGKQEVKELDLSSTHSSMTSHHSDLLTSSYASQQAFPQEGNSTGSKPFSDSSLVRQEAMGELLDFLSGSFEGGTDINEPIKRSLDLLCSEEDKDWNRADILIVTDSEIPPADAELMEKLEYQIDENELQVHGLIVGPRQTANLKAICTDIHIFDEWDVIKYDM